MRPVGEQRYAVIPPYPARWLLTEMASGRPVTKASMAAHAVELAERGGEHGRFFASQVLGAWRQLEAAAMDGEPDAPTVLRQLRPDRPERPPSTPGPGGAA